MKQASKVIGRELKRAVIGGGVLVAIGMPLSSAHAQREPLPQPPTIKVVDENGVDVVSGAMLGHGAEHSIGTPESGLRISRKLSSSPTAYEGYLRDDYAGSMNFNSFPNHVDSRAKEHMLVIYGGGSYQFRLVNGVYQPYRATSTSLVFSCSERFCTLTEKDGTVIEYDKTQTSTDYRFPARDGLVTKVTKPDGEVLSYTYQPGGRRIAVQSSLGWLLKTKISSSYDQVPSYQLINTGSDYCDLAAQSCEQLTAYPSFTDRVDVAGHTWSSSSAGAGTKGSFAFSSINLVDPRNVTVTYSQYNSNPAEYPASLSGRVFSVVRGGVTWGYGTTYVNGSQIGASMGLWRTTTGRTGKIGSKQFVYWPEESRLVQYTDELGRRTSFPSYSGSNPTLVVHPDATFRDSNTDPIAGATVTGGYTSFNYDSRGNQIESRQVPRNADKDHSRDLVWTASYPLSCDNPKTCNKPTSVTDPRSATTVYTYDPRHGGVLTETRPPVNGVEHQTRYVYEQFTPYIRTSDGGSQAQPKVWRLTQTLTCRTKSLDACKGTADELKIVIGYGTNNVLPVSKTVGRGDDSGSTTTKFTYDVYGNVIIEDGPRPGMDDAVYSLFDARRFKIGEIGPNPGPDPDGVQRLPRNATRTVYGSDGQVEEIIKGTVTTTNLTALQAMTLRERQKITYSTSHGKPVVTRLYDSGSTPLELKQLNYDEDLRLKCSTVRMKRSEFNGDLPDACSIKTKDSDPLDRITLTEYDVAGAVTRITKGYSTAVASVERTNGYDATSGRLAWMEDANGNRNSYEYDELGRLYRWYFPTKAVVGAHTHDVNDFEQYCYDKNENRTSLRKRDGRIIGFSYDAYNRVIEKMVTDASVQNFACANLPSTSTHKVFYGYDNLGAQLYARFDSAEGKGVTTTYDTIGWQKSSSNNLGGVTRTLEYGYDAYGNRTRITHPDGVSFEYEYDGLSRLVKVRENGPTVAVAMTWNSNGQRSAITRGAAVSSYNYDGLSRVSSIGDEFATPGNNITTTLQYNPASQIISSVRSNTAYAYSGHKDLKLEYKVNGLNQYYSVDSNRFSYDANGNLTSDGGVTYAYDAENRLVSASAGGASLSYDPLGRLFQTNSSSGGMTQFLYDGDELIGEYSSSGSLLRRYVHGLNDDDPLLWYEGSGLSDRRSLQTDHQGSIVSVASANGGNLAIYNYDEYGVPGARQTGRFQYTAQAWIPELGMYYYKARIYSPMLGRFMQTDPIGYDDQVNIYAYVANDPVNQRDPDGKQSVPMIGSNYDTDSQIRAACGGNSTCEQQARKDAAEVAITGLSFAPIGGVAVKGAEWGVRTFQAWRAERALERAHIAAASFKAVAEKAGTNLAGVGEMVGWGGGRSAAAEAAARTGTVDKAAVAGMREAGLTRGLAESARDMYKAAAATGKKGGEVAVERFKLMEKVLKNW